MFVLKKILTPFLLPSGVTISILLMSGVWLIYKKHRGIGLLNFTLGMSMWLLSISPVTDLMFRGLESEVNIPADLNGDVIILLGGGAYDGALDLSGVGAPGEDMLVRMVTAVRLQRKLEIPVIISGGSVFNGKKAEAPIVGRFLADLGVPADKVILEDRSRDTIENAKYSIEICRKNGFKRPVLVTSAYHMKRSVMSFEKVGLKVIPVAAGFKTWQNKKYGWEDYLPGDLGEMSIAMHEYLGLLFYKAIY